MPLTKITGAGAEGLTLSSTSLTVANGLTLTDGDVALASGHGISFAATSDGGVSTPSELLDDYEEGTFTAVLTGASAAPSSAISVQSAYVKVGNQVFVRIYMANVDTSGASGTAQITGFPFTSSSLNILPCMTYGQDYDDSGGVMTVHMYIENGTTANLIATKDNAAWQTTSITAGSGKYWAVTGSYLTS